MAAIKSGIVTPSTKVELEKAEAIRRWQPWAKSTGPRSPDGKARAARNADKGGGWRETRELFKLLNQEMRQQREVLGEVEQAFMR